MTSPQMHAPPYPDRKPRDDEMDIFGVTHPGKVRSENQDQFLVCSLRKEAVIHQTSLPEASNLTAGSERVALLMMVADGVGGGQKGAEQQRKWDEGAPKRPRWQAGHSPAPSRRDGR